MPAWRIILGFIIGSIPLVGLVFANDVGTRAIIFEGALLALVGAMSLAQDDGSKRRSR